jgi:hypothetical protein
VIQIPTDHGPLYLNLDRVVAVRIIEPEGRWDIEVTYETGTLMGTLTAPSEDQVTEIMAALSGEDD